MFYNNTNTNPLHQLNLNWPSLLVLIRHGESEGNKYGRTHMAQVMKRATHQYGLTPLGEEQAKHTGAYIRERFGGGHFDVHFTSTYRRAQETFRWIFDQEPIIDARINEINRGYPSLMAEEEIAKRYEAEVMTFSLNGWYHNIPLCGQSCTQIEHVIHSFLAFLREACGGKKVVIVGHGTWINLCCRILLNRHPEEAEALHAKQYFSNAGVTVFERDAQGRLIQTAENIVPWQGLIAS